MTDTHAASAPSSISSVTPLRAETAAQLPDTLAAVEGGGVTSARGFRAAGVHAGFRKDPNRLDLALVAADKPCACAAVFTQNVFCAAPVTVSREHLEDCGYGIAQAVVVNSGNANAATGERGLAAARETADIASDVLGCAPAEVMVASTGVIGQVLPIEPIEETAPLLASSITGDGSSLAAKAIMTTDTVSGDGIGYDGCTFTVGGMAKGSGMIMPNMATMIAVLTTDAPVRPDALHAALSRAVGVSFNKVTVDSDTSTNDSCFLFSNGGATSSTVPFHPGSPALARFEQALDAVCQNLARQMAADGEGATRLVTVNVTGAATPADADAAARAVANSPLVKTAVYGHDANWGRVAMAIGKSGAAFRQEDAAIDIMGLPVCRGGLTVPFDEDEALRRFENPEIAIDVDLGAGDAATTVWTCDFSHDYVTINGDYRS